MPVARGIRPPRRADFRVPRVETRASPPGTARSWRSSGSAYGSLLKRNKQRDPDVRPRASAPAFLTRSISPGYRRIRAYGGSLGTDRNCARRREHRATRCGELRRREIRPQGLRGPPQTVRAGIT